MIKEIERVKYKNIEFRLIDKPHVRIVGGKKYKYRWVIQVRPEGQFRFDAFFDFQKKSEALKMLINETKLITNYVASREAVGVIRRLVNF